MAKRIPLSEGDGELTHHPFAALRPAGASAEDTPTVDGRPQPEPAGDPGVPERKTEPRAGPSVVVRREKKGRAGKSVTRITGLGVTGRELEQLSRKLKRALGCGASVEDGDVVLQGVLTERAAEWLRDHHRATVTIGN